MVTQSWSNIRVEPIFLAWSNLGWAGIYWLPLVSKELQYRQIFVQHSLCSHNGFSSSQRHAIQPLNTYSGHLLYFMAIYAFRSIKCHNLRGNLLLMVLEVNYPHIKQEVMLGEREKTKSLAYGESTLLRDV